MSLLDFCAKLDWVTPWKDLCKDITHTSHHDFYVDRYTGWSGAKIRRLLEHHSIHLWGLGYTDDLITFKVSKEEAKQAQSILLRASVPVCNVIIME